MRERVASVVRIDDTCQIILGNAKLDLGRVGLTVYMYGCYIIDLLDNVKVKLK